MKSSGPVRRPHSLLPAWLDLGEDDRPIREPERNSLAGRGHRAGSECEVGLAARERGDVLPGYDSASGSLRRRGTNAPKGVRDIYPGREGDIGLLDLVGIRD